MHPYTWNIIHKPPNRRSPTMIDTSKHHCSVRFALTCISLSLGTVTATAQDGYGQGGTQTFSFFQSVEMTRCELNGTEIKTSQGYPEKALAPAGAGFVVVKEVDAAAIIKFLSWPSTTPNYTAFNVEMDSKTNVAKIKLWCVNRDTLKATTRRYYSRSPWYSPDFAFGILVVPVKLRPGYGDITSSFTTDFSLGTALDMNWQISNYRDIRVHVPIFVAVGSSTVKASESELAKDEDKPTLSFGVGIGFSGDGVGAAIIGGLDVINDNDAIEWEHQWLPWIGFSIGTSFGLSSEASKAQ